MTRHRDGKKILTVSGCKKKIRIKGFYNLFYRKKRKNTAISQIMGTTLLLLIAVAMMAMVYSYFLSYPMPHPTSHVEFIGSLKDKNITLLHFSGEKLKLDTILSLNIGHSIVNVTVGEYLDSKSKNDGFWNIGEKLVYPVGDTTGIKVGATIADKESYSVIFNGWFKETFSDTAEFCVEIGKEGNMLRIPDTLNVIVVYTDKDNDGWVQTIELAPDGGITATLDTLEFDPNFCNNPNLIHISGSYYALCYRGQDSNGTLKTVQIAANGSINDTIQDSLVFDSGDCIEPDIIHISGNVYAISYRGVDEDGFLKTIEILPDGDITNVIDTLEFAPDDKIKIPDISHITNDIYAIVYRGFDEDGFLKTVEIADNGTITDPVIDTLEFDTNTGNDPDMIHVYGNIYAIAYEGQGQNGYLKTVEIKDTGDINNTIIDSAMFDGSKGKEPDIIDVSESIYAIAYSGTGDSGMVITAMITNNGSIVNPTVDAFEFSTYCKTPRIIHISSNYFAISYRDTGNEGLLTTVHIANDGEFL